MESDLDWTLRRQAGVISRKQALRHMHESVLRRHLSNGRWQVAHRGIYVTHNGPITRTQRTWIGLLAVGAGHPRVALGGLAALAEDGFRDRVAQRLDIYLPARMSIAAPPDFVRVRRVRQLTADNFPRVAWPPRTTTARSTIDAARWAPDDYRARAIIASVVQQRLATPEQLIDAAYAFGRLSRRALIFATIHDAAGGSESISEQDFLILCRQNGLPTPSRQSSVRDSTGRARFRDAFFEEWNLHVEIDGSQHMSVESWWADMQRQNAMWTPGARVLRFPAWAVRNEPDKVVEVLRQALIDAGWRPNASLSIPERRPDQLGYRRRQKR